VTHRLFCLVHGTNAQKCEALHTVGSVHSMASWINSERLATPSFNIILARYVSTVLRERKEAAQWQNSTIRRQYNAIPPVLECSSA
jgi:hypothetical protein